MSALEEYLGLEGNLRGLDDESSAAELCREVMDRVWSKLSRDDVDWLNSRRHQSESSSDHKNPSKP